jgi:threonine/homoserine/homoserine lactone efflux protein
MGVHDVWLFIVAGLLLNITPGPDMALVIARSTHQGTRAGVAAALGIGVGLFVHIAAAAIGISTIILASAWEFTALKWIGALYLVYIGVGMIWGSLLPKRDGEEPREFAVTSLSESFVQGFLTNIFNPKVAVFFLAFLPQFIDVESPSKVVAFVVLGALFDTTGTIWNLGVAWFAGRVGASAWLSRLKTPLDRAIGALFLAVGVKLAFAERP